MFSWLRWHDVGQNIVVGEAGNREAAHLVATNKHQGPGYKKFPSVSCFLQLGPAPGHSRSYEFISKCTHDPDVNQEHLKLGKASFQHKSFGGIFPVQAINAVAVLIIAPGLWC